MQACQKLGVRSVSRGSLKFVAFMMPTLQRPETCRSVGLFGMNDAVQIIICSARSLISARPPCSAGFLLSNPRASFPGHAGRRAFGQDRTGLVPGVDDGVCNCRPAVHCLDR